MKVHEYQALVRGLDFGKRLPNAIYLYRYPEQSLGKELDELLEKVVKSLEVGPKYNVLKFRLDEYKMSFLAYPTFFEDPHPALSQSLTIDLGRGKSRDTSYAGQSNRPILHRKECFLPEDHPSWEKFKALTKAEEAAGLLEDSKSIGFQLNWDRLLVSKGFTFKGHKLKKTKPRPQKDQKEEKPATIERHKTAMVRYDLSKPIKTLLEFGMLKKDTDIFDYGCGQGADVKGLSSLGYKVSGWDPAFRKEERKKAADVVNLGFVLNVIEDPAERVETLCEAYELTKKLLVVSSLVGETMDTREATAYQDGVLTKRNTFQKYYHQQELQHFIEDALEVSAQPVALGIFYVFKSPQDHQDFVMARTRRPVDWSSISSRLGLGAPAPRERRIRPTLYDLHKEVLEPFWEKLLELGRQPKANEYEDLPEVRKRLGSPNRAERLFIERGGGEELEQGRQNRINDLLVYLGLANFRKKVPFIHLSDRLKRDIKLFFGHYKIGLQKGLDLLFAAGDPDEIDLACEDLPIGWQDHQALYIHRDLLPRLPPVLRLLVGCATQLYGDVAEADIIKIHRRSGKVTFLAYDDFQGKRLPELTLRIKVDLRRLFVSVFDHSGQGQILFYKERFLPPEHADWEALNAYGKKLSRIGIEEQVGFGPDKAQFLTLLDELSLTENLNKRRKKAKC
jgi:DNA phosphorothioation-associated putative methyltransferase